MSLYNWIGFIFLLLLVAAYTLYYQRTTHSSQSYFVADKQTHLFALVATLVMTELNTSTLVGFASLGYSYGFSAVSLSLVFLIGLLFYAITVAKKWKAFDGVTITTYFDRRYNKTIGYLSAIVLLTAMIGFSANYIKSITLIFHPVFPGLSQWLLSGLFCFIMAVITLRGGLKSIIKIDIISFLITLIIFPILFYYSASEYGVDYHSAAGASGSTFPTSMLAALIIITAFTYILAPWYGQKIFAARSEKTAFKAVTIAAVIIAGIYALAILATSSLLNASITGLQAQEAIPYLIHHNMPVFLEGIAYGMLFFISATTLVGLWNTIASVIISHHHTKIRHTSLKTSIALTAFTACVSYLLANIFIDHIFEKMVLMNIPISSLAFPLLGGFYWKKVNALASIISILITNIGGFFCYFYFGQPHYMWYWAVYIIPLSFILGAGVTMLSHLNKR